MDEIHRLFVYGSLMEGFFNAPLLRGAVAARHEARTRGELYHQPEKGYPAMLEGDDWVYGELIWIRHFDEVITSVDAAEHYLAPDDPRNEYNRVLREVESLEDHRRYRAYIYMYNCRDCEAFRQRARYLPDGRWEVYMTVQ